MNGKKGNAGEAVRPPATPRGKAKRGGYIPSNGKRCSGCCHKRKLDGNLYACLYILDTGKKRGYRPEECPYYEHDEKKKKELARRCFTLSERECASLNAARGVLE